MSARNAGDDAGADDLLAQAQAADAVDADVVFAQVFLEDELQRRASPHVVFPGALYGADYRTLQRRALVYIQATEVGGTHPALIEAMGSGGAVLALDTPENREVGGDAVGYFGLHPDSLSGILCEWLADAGLREALRERARRRAAAEYGWDAVTDAYEQLFRKIG